MNLSLIRRYLSVLVLNLAFALTVRADVLPGVSALSDSVVRESTIAFVNNTISPGLEGATLTVDDGNRDSEQVRGSLGFAAEFTIRRHIFNGYWGLALVGGSLDDKFGVTGDAGQPIRITLNRDVLALRGSIGLSFPINSHIKLRPYLSLSVSDLRNEILVDGLLSTAPVGSPTTTAVFNTSAQLTSTTGSIDALYSRWWGDNRLELSAHYHLIYTDAFSEDNPVLQTDAWNDILQLKSRFSGATNLTTIGRSWRWMVYANHTNFLTQDKFSLGYTSLFEFGAGLDWKLNIKPLDWFGWQMLGLKAGIITSNNVLGYSVGLTAR